MRDKKFKKTLSILDEEIERMNTLFHIMVDYAKVIHDEKLKKHHMSLADEYFQRYMALCDLKSRLYKELA